MAAALTLGKGLASIIPPKRGDDSGSVPAERVVRDVPIAHVHPNPHQPRANFAHADLETLVESIRIHGILQPLVVTQRSDGQYELIAGERRLRAAQLLELATVPALVRTATDPEKLELALIENIQRADLNPIERALGYQKLIQQFGFTQEQVAQRTGSSRASVANTLRFLQLSDEIRQALRETRISEGQAKVLLSLSTPDEQRRYFERILRDHLTVRQLEQATRGVRRAKQTAAGAKDIVLSTSEARLREYLGTKVAIEQHGHEGQLVIHYYSPEELRGIIDRILNDPDV